MFKDVIRKRFTTRLSGVPCTAEMKKGVIDKAIEFEVTPVELQRIAVDFFLASDVKKSDIYGQSNGHKKGA
jgi:hypothetical protein